MILGDIPANCCKEYHVNGWLLRRFVFSGYKIGGGDMKYCKSSKFQLFRMNGSG